MHGTNIRKPPTMLWWQRSSWLPCPSGKAGLDDDMIVASGRKGDKYAVFGIFFWFRRRRLSSRGRKLRHVTDGEAIPSKNSSLDISLARSSSAGTPSSSDNSPPRSSSSAGSQPSPLPLPLPEVQALLRRVANSGNSSPYSGKTPLPSPKKSHPHRDEEAHSLQRFFNQAARRTRENPVTQSRKSPAPEPNGCTETISGQCLDASFCYWLSPEKKTASSIDNSPTQSPNRSTRNATNSASSLTRRGNNAPVNNVHPLPLPPGVPALTPHSPALPITSKADQMPLKGQWQKGKLIGRGTFGSVYIASNRETGALCAMKEVEICPDDPKSAECVRQVEQEIKVLSKLKHPNIVQYYGSEIVGDRFFIYLEYVHPGSINKFIRDHCGAITESVVRNFTRHILSGLAYLHSKKTIHRDIKGANLLVDAYGVVKLADFGMAKHLSGQAGPLSMKGSPYWIAPELLQSVAAKDPNADHALAVDIWSLGCTIIEMMNGKPPWSENEGPAAMFKVLKESPPIPDSLSPEGKDFLRCCFCRNPADRPTASVLLEHQFIKNSHQLDIPHGLKLTDNLQIKKELRYQKHEKGKVFSNTSLSSKEL